MSCACPNPGSVGHCWAVSTESCGCPCHPDVLNPREPTVRGGDPNPNGAPVVHDFRSVSITYTPPPPDMARVQRAVDWAFSMVDAGHDKIVIIVALGIGAPMAKIVAFSKAMAVELQKQRTGVDEGKGMGLCRLIPFVQMYGINEKMVARMEGADVIGVVGAMPNELRTIAGQHSPLVVDIEPPCHCPTNEEPCSLQ